MIVSIDCNAQALVATYPRGGEAHRLSWEMLRLHDASAGVRLIDARLLPVAVTPDGDVRWEGLPDTRQTTGPVPEQLRCVAAGGSFDAERPKRGWTLSERWRVVAWSPLTAEAEGDDCVWRRADGVEVARGHLLPEPAATVGAPDLPFVAL